MKIARYRKESEVTYALGATVVMEYLNNAPELVTAVILHPQFRAEETIEKISRITGQRGIPVSTEEKPFNILSQKENCFVIAVITKKEKKLDPADHVVLVNPSNAGNMGTIVRSCIGFGVNNLAIIKPAVDFFDPKTIRASMGACARINVETFDSFDDYLRKYPGNNLYPFMLDGSTKLQNTEIKEPFALIFGNEATGLPSDFQNIGSPIRIEHGSGIDSLNLPIAASIALYSATGNRFS
ncbi:MAG: TrmH family RNA methyltransferase [Clostridiales bacterium]|nr:TrmH family RNA methyltransferase [Clostridiales bacterium]